MSFCTSHDAPVSQPCGHTLRAPHIEAAEGEFYVAWEAPAYSNVLAFKACTRWARVMARTGEGALQIARYHHYRGGGHRLLSGRPEGDGALPAQLGEHRRRDDH